MALAQRLLDTASSFNKRLRKSARKQLVNERLAQATHAKQVMIAKALGKPVPVTPPQKLQGRMACTACGTPQCVCNVYHQIATPRYPPRALIPICSACRQQRCVCGIAALSAPSAAMTAAYIGVCGSCYQYPCQCTALQSKHYAQQMQAQRYQQMYQQAYGTNQLGGLGISLGQLGLGQQQVAQAYGVSAGTTQIAAATFPSWGTTNTNYTIGYDLNGQVTRVYHPSNGEETRISFDDGSYIEVDVKGGYKMYDKDAKVTYAANRSRAFNRYVNASDLLAEFIEYLGSLKLRRGDVQTLPVGLFINWLIIRAAEADEDAVPDDIVPVPQHKLLVARVKPRCLFCARFIPRRIASAGFVYCNPIHAEKHHQRLLAA